MKKKGKKTSKRTRTAEQENSTEDEDTGSGDAEEGRTGRRPAINYEAFVRTWRDSESLSDVAAHFEIARTSATAIASRLRKGGVDLKPFARRGAQTIDAKALNKILKES